MPAKPIDLLSKKESWQWTSAQENAFNKLKELFTSLQLLVHFDYNCVNSVLSSLITAVEVAFGVQIASIHLE